MPVRFRATPAVTFPDEWPDPALIGAEVTVVLAGTNTPANISEDEAGTVPIADSVLTVTSEAMVPGFWSQDDLQELDAISGSFRVPLDSLQGIRDFAQDAATSAGTAASEAASASAAAQAALEDAQELFSQILVLPAGGIIPPGTPEGTLVFYRG